MTALTPTAEQQAIIDTYRAGQQMVVQARAGTGKTSTLKMLAAATPQRSGIYIAYNRAIATDAARSFPRNIECRTAHSLAFRAIGHQYKRRLDGPRQPARIVAQLLGVRPLRIDASLLLSETQVARIVLDTVARFCRSADPEITRWHVPFIEGITDPEARGRLRDTVVPLARKAWADLSQTEGRLRFQHDHYLKLWQLQGPRLEVDVVMLDEAQDANPLIADIVERQTHAQRVMVGDAAQAIYAWNGAVDAVEKFDPSAPRLYLSESFRFGPVIAEEANKWLGILGENPKLTGRASHASNVARLPEPDAILCRTNAGAVGELMAAAEDGKCAALVGGGDAIKRLAEAARELQRGIPTSHPELIAFQTWGQVRDYCLAPETRLLTTDLRWQRIDLLEPGDKLVGFDEEPQPGNPTRRFRTVTVESTRHIVRPSYRVTTSDGVSVVASEEHRWLVRSGNNFRWKQTKAMTSGDRIISIGRWDEEDTKDAGWLAGLFDGEGCLTGPPTARSRVLSVSQMEGPVLERARALLKERGFAFGDYRNGHGVRQLYVRGELAEQLRLLGTIRPGRLIAKAQQLWEERRVRVGRVATVVSVESVGDQEVVAIRTDGRTFIAEGLLSHNCDQESAGSDLKVFVKLIDDHGANMVIATMDRLVDERYAQVVVSTAHKAKGREWDRVRVAGDFREPKGEDASVSPDEAMLAYVTVTRARRVLDRGGLAWVDGWIAGQPASVAEQLVLEDLDDGDDLDDCPSAEEIDREERREEAKHLATSDEDYSRRVEDIASEASTVTAAGFPCTPGDRLIDGGRRPAHLAR